MPNKIITQIQIFKLQINVLLMFLKQSRQSLVSSLFLLIVLNIVAPGTLIVFAQSNANQIEQQIQEIYGVRWFLGDYFSFHTPQNPPKNQQMFVLMFNSKAQIDDQIYLKINGTRYGCYERFLEIQSAGQHHYEHNKQGSHQGQNFTNAMYKCTVYVQNFSGSSQVDYQIISGWAIFQGSGNTTHTKNYRQQTLFQGKLRIPQNMERLSFFFLADWGLITQNVSKSLGYKDVMPSMVKNLAQNPNIGLLLFGGDLAYDFQGQMYIKMLTYMQPLTSLIPMIVTPGNHESVYHEDSFELYVESYFTPMWYKYFNYFSLSIIQSQKLVILSFDPQNTIFTQVNRLGQNLTQIFEKELADSVTEFIKNNYDVVVFSHYPIYCSEEGQHYQTCEQNKIRFAPFIKKFQKMGLDVYLSGHLHLYQRTKQICNQSSFKHNDSNIYDKSCPIYVIQGAAGNNDWVQMQKRGQLKNFSQTQVYGTGYGLATVSNRNISYQHFKVYDRENASIVDSFVLYQKTQNPALPEDKRQRDSKTQTMGGRLILILEVLALAIIGGLSGYLICRLRGKNKQTDDSKTPRHEEMMQQNFQTPPNNNKNLSKQDQIQID